MPGCSRGCGQKRSGKNFPRERTSCCRAESSHPVQLPSLFAPPSNHHFSRISSTILRRECFIPVTRLQHPSGPGIIRGMNRNSFALPFLCQVTAVSDGGSGRAITTEIPGGAGEFVQVFRVFFWEFMQSGPGKPEKPWNRSPVQARIGSSRLSAILRRYRRSTMVPPVRARSKRVRSMPGDYLCEPVMPVRISGHYPEIFF